MARERAMQVYYAWHISHSPVEELMQDIAAESLQAAPERLRFTERLVYTAMQREPELDAIIKEHVAHWEMDRIAVLDLIIMRLGIIEFLEFSEIPTKVSINEWVEIAKKFSTEKSGLFINGMLDSILATLTKDKRVAKAGRGLIDR
jgi:N utilization substance protein B